MQYSSVLLLERREHVQTIACLTAGTALTLRRSKLCMLNILRGEISRVATSVGWSLGSISTPPIFDATVRSIKTYSSVLASIPTAVFFVCETLSFVANTGVYQLMTKRP